MVESIQWKATPGINAVSEAIPWDITRFMGMEYLDQHQNKFCAISRFKICFDSPLVDLL